MASLSRMKVAELAEYAAKVLRLPERECYRYEGGPLPRAALLSNIEREEQRQAGVLT